VPAGWSNYTFTDQRKPGIPHARPHDRVFGRRHAAAQLDTSTTSTEAGSRSSRSAATTSASNWHWTNDGSGGYEVFAQNEGRPSASLHPRRDRSRSSSDAATLTNYTLTIVDRRTTFAQRLDDDPDRALRDYSNEPDPTPRWPIRTS
jgi:hypothetical protein